MKTKNVRTYGRSVFLATCIALSCGFASPSFGKGPDVHLCQFVPGETVAEAVQGKIMETKAAEDRCVYIVAMPEGSGSAAFAIYRHEPVDYEGLRAEMEEGVTKVDGLGDEAALSFDKDANRYWLLVVKRGLVTLQVSGVDKDMVHRVAAAALQQYAGR
ncbi:MAG: hypothetical protein ACYC9M_12755 [Desulfobulbaceae bacterium]